jgi:hypothetical protein
MSRPLDPETIATIRDLLGAIANLSSAFRAHVGGHSSDAAFLAVIESCERAVVRAQALLRAPESES